MSEDVALDLDSVHARAIEDAAALDRDWFRRHPGSVAYVRAGLMHELCPPGSPCVPVSRVLVQSWAPGIRSRRLMP